MDLNSYSNNAFNRGSSKFKEGMWVIFSGLLFSSWLPGSSWRVLSLRLFGAKIGKGVVIKPRVIVKFPWKLSIGDHSWIGEAVWLDNLSQISIGNNSCVSQGAYLCTGSHDWSKSTFDLIIKPIKIGDQVWLGACSYIAPGVVVGNGAIIGFGSNAKGDFKSNTISHSGYAQVVKQR